MVGQILGNYRVLGELSRGGMGAIYRAEHELLGRSAAIKLLRPELSADEDLVKRFFDEARAASAIHHPAIIDIYDFGYTPAGDAYYVMELLDGESLAARLAKRGTLGELEASAIARDIASALKAAHDAGIIHRDLKPDNIFLVRSGDGDRVKVLDFGVAKLVDRGTEGGRTQTGVLMGTPLYMAPEQAREARRIDHRADLYSLGCLLYEMLVGKPPFVAEGAGEIIAMQMFTPPEAPRTRMPAISDEVDALVMRLLAKEPSERPASAAEVHQHLSSLGSRLSLQLTAELATSEAPQRRMPTPLPVGNALRLGVLEAEMPPPPEKRGSLGMVAGLATLLLAGAIVMIFVLTQRSDDRPAKTEPALEATTPAPTVPPAPAPASPPTETPPAQPIEPAHAAAIRRPTRPQVAKPQPATAPEGGPVVRPETPTEGTITSPAPREKTQGPVTEKGSPIEPSLDDTPPPAPNPP